MAAWSHGEGLSQAGRREPVGRDSVDPEANGVSIYPVSVMISVLAPPASSMRG